ncbi:ABC transporter permease [Gleimia sp. 6138-11-ORH1]|uniref:FtsX-like permease family protein n=1 Tax=Gleimia sp. 6138-11-ORH1 TaxID=2973937 RepID=UPI00216A063B|nr:ABC transporter permease [Gleimia sp. 6138-11-ORH1]MCS4484776.1 ABC transporter permease [Gleimia sp. 6138-11-ORH1]
MKGLLKANVKSHASRYVATSIAIALATAFILACLGIANGFYKSIERSLANDSLGADVVISLHNDAPADSKALLEADKTLRENKTYDKIRTVYFVFSRLENNGFQINARILETPQEPFKFLDLEAGKTPSAADEAAIDRNIAKALRVDLNDTITVEGYDSEANEPVEKTLRITGIYPAGTISIPTVTTSAETAKLFNNAETRPTYILLAGTDVTSVTQTLTEAGKIKDLDIQTQTSFVTNSVDKFTNGTGVMLAILVTFPALAIITAIIVVSTTFNVLLAQRKRELALLRAIGATSQQIRNLALKEALLVGTFSALMGVIAGTLLSGVLNYFTGLTVTWQESFLTASPAAVAISFTLGLLIALIASFGPARRIAGVSPMVALHPEDPNAMNTKKRTFRAVIGSVIFALGTGTMLGAIYTLDGGNRFALAFVGGMISFLGALFLIGILMPKLSSALGRLIGKLSLTTQLASENTVRNPTRTGATGTALFLGVTLVVMIMVGAESVRHTVLAEIDSKRPVDAVAVASADTEFSAADIERIKSLQYVQGALPTDQFLTSIAIDEQPTQMASILKNVDLADYAHSEVRQPSDSEILVPNGEFLPASKEVTVATGSVQLKLKPVPAGVPGYVVSKTNFEKLAAEVPKAQPWIPEPGSKTTPNLGEISAPVAQRVVYLKIDNNIPSDEVNSLFNKISNNNEFINVGGGLTDRLLYTKILNIMLGGVIGMLAVSVFVALVGVTNTLALSVVERRRESALLRALGMTRASVRNMLSIEALLIGLSSLLLGILLGTFYGWAGFMALPLNEIVDSSSLQIPWLQILGISATVILAALLASLAPGRKAAKAHPVEAMADVS